MVIANINMPKCCYDCPAFLDSSDYPTCVLTGRSRGYNFYAKEGRMSDCPLVEMNLRSYVLAQLNEVKINRPDIFPLLSAALEAKEINMNDIFK